MSIAEENIEENKIANRIIGIAIDVHAKLGPGLLESAYKECLNYKLKQGGFIVEKEKGMPLTFEEVRLDCGYRIDLLVENKVVLEIKSVEALKRRTSGTNTYVYASGWIQTRFTYEF